MYCFINIVNNRFEKIVPLEQEKGIEIGNSIKNTHRILSTHQSLSYVKDALTEMEQWCVQAKTGGEYIVRNQHTAERFCRGFLFEFRTYLDHIQTMLSHEYGKDSEILQEFLAGTHSAYDNAPEYGFTYQLRNCSQHCNNIVHKVVNNQGKGVRPVSTPTKLLADFSKWKEHEKNYIESHSENIDLQKTFEKTFDALSYVHTPVIQYMLNQNGTAADIIYLRKLADWLLEIQNISAGDIWNWHFAHAIHSDESEATIEEYNNKIPDINFQVQIVDWESIYNLSNSLNK